MAARADRALAWLGLGQFDLFFPMRKMIINGEMTPLFGGDIQCMGWEQ